MILPIERVAIRNQYSNQHLGRILKNTIPALTLTYLNVTDTATTLFAFFKFFILPNFERNPGGHLSYRTTKNFHRSVTSIIPALSWMTIWVQISSRCFSTAFWDYATCQYPGNVLISLMQQKFWTDLINHLAYQAVGWLFEDLGTTHTLEGDWITSMFARICMKRLDQPFQYNAGHI